MRLHPEVDATLLATVAARASTLDDRLRGAYVPDDGDAAAALADARLATWCAVVADGDAATFERRLAHERIDLARARRAVGPVRAARGTPLPPWTTTLGALLAAVPDVAVGAPGTPDGPSDRALVVGHPLAFEELLVAAVGVAREALRARERALDAWLAPEAQATLERNLLRWLSRLGARTLGLEFAVFRSARLPATARHDDALARSRTCYEAFLRHLRGGGATAVLGEYAVLTRLLCTGLDLWVEGTAELVRRLAADAAELVARFGGGTPCGPVVAIEPAVSDRHHGGRAVQLLTFASGLRLVYKPKALGTERAFADLLTWLETHGLRPALRRVEVLERDGYGWAEYVEAEPCADRAAVRRYYERAGILLCLAHLLGATDLHAENVIAAGEHPVLVDLETLLHPEPREDAVERGAGAAASDWLQRTVLRTGLLPRWEFSRKSHGMDHTGLGGGYRGETPRPVALWSHPNTDAMTIAHRVVGTRVSPNAPTLGGARAVLADHLEPLVAGFRRAWRFVRRRRRALLAAGGPLAAFARQEVRFIGRTTATYDLALARAGHPAFLRDGAEHGIQLDVLARRLVADAATRWQDVPLLAREREELERLDVPYFTARADDTTLHVPGGPSVPDYFAEASFATTRARLAALDEEELARQEEVIRGSLFARAMAGAHVVRARARSPEAAAHTPPHPDALLAQALRIADGLAARARRAGGGAAWIGPRYVPEACQYQMDVVPDDLYAGTTGIALFLATAGRLGGASELLRLAREAVVPLIAQLSGEPVPRWVRPAGVGGATGWGSIAYGLTRLATLLDEPALLDAATGVARHELGAARLATDAALDVVSGAAGALLALLALHRATDDPAVLDAAVACGERLVAAAEPTPEGGRGWRAADGRLHTGFSHGAAGIALALWRLHAAVGDERFGAAALAGVRFENAVRRSPASDWPDFRLPRPHAQALCAWCHGAPGVGLARLGMLATRDAPGLRDDVEAALALTTAAGVSPVDQLCCGNAGRAEFLACAGAQLERPDARRAAAALAGGVLARAERRGGFALRCGRGTYAPGLFQGVAGIGYTLLRLARPALVPSVLLWEG